MVVELSPETKQSPQTITKPHLALTRRDVLVSLIDLGCLSSPTNIRKFIEQLYVDIQRNKVPRLILLLGEAELDLRKLTERDRPLLEHTLVFYSNDELIQQNPLAEDFSILERCRMVRVEEEQKCSISQIGKGWSTHLRESFYQHHGDLAREGLLVLLGDHGCAVMQRTPGMIKSSKIEAPPWITNLKDVYFYSMLHFVPSKTSQSLVVPV